MGYSNWVVINVFNFTKTSIDIRNVSLYWGKWHRNGDKSAEIMAEIDNPLPFEKRVVKAGESFAMSSCGRENSPTGTNGEFDLFDADDNHICHVYWDCPWASSTNTFMITGKSPNYDVTTTGENLMSGGLGEVRVNVRPKHNSE